MVGFPNKPMGFPTKNDQHLGCEMEVPPFKETYPHRSYEILHQNQPEVFESDIQPESSLAHIMTPWSSKIYSPPKTEWNPKSNMEALKMIFLFNSRCFSGSSR